MFVNKPYCLGSKGTTDLGDETQVTFFLQVLFYDRHTPTRRLRDGFEQQALAYSEFDTHVVRAQLEEMSREMVFEYRMEYILD